MQGFAFVGDDGQIYRFIGSKTMTKRQDEHDAAQERQRREQAKLRAATAAKAEGRFVPGLEGENAAFALRRADDFDALHAARHSPEPEPQPVRGPADVLADMQTLAAGFPRLSPSGVETAAAQLAALVGELQAMQERK